MRDQIQASLHGEGGLRPASATIGRVGHLVGCHDSRRRGEVRNLVGTRQMDGGVVGDRDAHRIPRPTIDEERIPKGDDMALGVEADFDLVQLVARMAGAQQVLLPLFDPAHGAPDETGQEGDHQVFRVDVPLGAETSAHVQRHAADPRFGQLQEGRSRPANGVHHLCRRPDRHRIGSLVMSTNHATALDGNAGIAVGIKATPKPMGSGGESRRYPTFFDGKLADQVGRVLFMDDLRSRRQRGLRIHDRRQGFDVDSHQLGGIQGLIAGLGHDHRKRFAHMSDLAHGQHRLLRIVDGVRHGSSPLARQRQLTAGNRRRDALELRTREHPQDTRHRRRPVDIDRADAAVRPLTSDKDGVQHARNGQIGDKLPASRQQSMILPPQHRASDKARRLLANHLPHLP